MVTLFLLLSQMACADSVPTRSPNDFKDVPKVVVDTLRAQNCLIPQSPFPHPNNLISGEFAKKGQKDWAALCLEGDQTKIVVFWGGKIKCASSLNLSKNSVFTAKTGSHSKFMRGISSISIKAGHDAINDEFFENTSTVAYCSNGKWTSSLGAD